MKDAKGPMPQRTRERIIQAGLDIFYEKGFNGADIVTIAGKAGVDKTTVLRHFKTKEALFDAAIDSELKRIMSRIKIDVEPGDDVVSDLFRLGTTFNKMIQSNVRFLRMIDSEYHNLHPVLWKNLLNCYNEYVSLFSAYFRHAKEKGLIADINEEIAAIAFFSFFYRSLVDRIFHDRDPLLRLDGINIRRFVTQFVGGLQKDKEKPKQGI